MAKVEGLNLRGTRWYVRIIVPDDLKEVYGRDRVNVALGTSDRKEALFRATVKRAEWAADFEAKRAALTLTQIQAIPPELAAHLAAMVRHHVLSEDDSLRSDVWLLAELVNARKAVHRLRQSPLRIPEWGPLVTREDDLTGLTAEEAAMLAGMNASMDGKAAVALAGGNLREVLPLVQAQAAALGIAFDVKTPGAREALLLCLRAYRTAHRDVTLRDAGEAVETPSRPAPLAVNTPKPTDRPKTLRDVFDRWKLSGDSPRKEDTIKAMDRALKQFEGQHPEVPLKDITREMGDAYLSWLRANSGTTKTARDRLTAIKSLLKYAHRTLEWSQRHTWEGLDIKSKTTNKRRAITADEMGKLFGTELHTRHALPKSKQAGREAAYWIPLIGAYTGARAGEVCQLRTADVQTVGDIPALVLTDDGEGQSIKTDAGNRTIPIHSELIRLGFLGYAEAMRKAGHVSLWPALPRREDRASDYFGRWFRDFRKALGMDGPGQPTFHYFRHTVRPLMRRAGFDSKTRDLVTGHETAGSVGDAVYDDVMMEELQPAVEAIRYPALASLPVVSPHASKASHAPSKAPA